MMIDCQAMDPYRDKCDLGPFIRLYRTLKPQYSSVKIYSLYLNDSNPEKVFKKKLSLYNMKVGWHRLMDIPL
jgi:hypothetical protein